MPTSTARSLTFTIESHRYQLLDGTTDSFAEYVNWYNVRRCGPLAEEAVEIGLDLREMLYRRHRFVYRILYTIEGDIVRIHRIHSASQDRLSSDDTKP
jgi:hypothetical protein